MKNLNIKPFIYILAVYTVLFMFIGAWILGLDLPKFLDYIWLLRFITFAYIAAYLIFTFWLWRCKFLQGWLVPFPDLNGTWEGRIQTDKGITPGSIPVILSIKQTFGHISCVMHTAEMKSRSYLEGFWIDSEEQIRKLCYSYTSKPKASLRDRSTPHDGTILFKIIGNPVNKLEGEYWTQRQTTGAITLSFREKSLLDELPDNLPIHPMQTPTRIKTS